MAKREERFVKTREYHGRGKNRFIEHSYSEVMPSGTHELLAVRSFSPGRESSGTFFFYTDDWIDDPPVPVTKKGMLFLRDVADDVIVMMERKPRR